jgi:WD domain, G-beta repeat
MLSLRYLHGRRPSMVQVVLLAILVGVILAFGFVRHRQASAAHPINALAFSPDGRTLACSISRSVPPGLDSRLNSLLTGRMARGPTFHEVRLWDLETRGITTCLAAFQTPVVCLAFSPDGKTLVTGGYKEWKAWDTSTWRCRSTSVGLTQ